jgi:hypothetical protein
MSEISDYIENDKTYELNIGKTFQNGSKISYHHFKCNYKLNHFVNERLNFDN